MSSMARLEQVMRSIKGLQAKAAPGQARLPITSECFAQSDRCGQQQMGAASGIT